MHQFLVVLSGTNPLVWRRIQVPEKYTFWDLHVAIQDAMGWLDYHLHELRLLDATEQQVVSNRMKRSCRPSGNCRPMQEARLKADAALAARAVRGRHVLVPGCGHWIPLDAPQAVIDVATAMVREVRQRA